MALEPDDHPELAGFTDVEHILKVISGEYPTGHDTRWDQRERFHTCPPSSLWGFLRNLGIGWCEL